MHAPLRRHSPEATDSASRPVYLLALDYGEAALGPLALGGLRDGIGSYVVGWLLALRLAVVRTLTALASPLQFGLRHWHE